MPSSPPVRALILAGGSGTRLWPLSTDARPKPFLPLAGPDSLLRETFRRAARVVGAENVLVSARTAHAELLRRELPEVPPGRLVLEPVRRNTAPAIALAALAVEADAPGAVLVVLPSDQAVRDGEAFAAALRTAVAAAGAGDAFVTLGIPPTRPETGFGYIETSGEPARGLASKGNADAALPVVRFVEKPEIDRARAFQASGRHLWNAGIFVFRIPLLLEEMKRSCPDVLSAARRAQAARSRGDLSSFEESFSSAPSISIDYAVMEKARRVLTVPCACGWSDLGSWEAVWDFRVPDERGNVSEGEVAAVDAANNLVLASGRPVCVIGLSEIAVVESPDGLLVTRRGASDALRRWVESRAKGGAP
ncbi:MAG TPA: sugar phosphate nucleotidyltransferase [Thermoanaerobaculia bacterium]|nr:sugar phosphate nucleotidyltransferase [Thermoanaerobaculia bacterium]